jgi:hypothetical protein
MVINRLLSGSAFAPEAFQVIREAYDAALRDLAISDDDDEAKERLARLILAVAGPMETLGAAELCEKATVEWKWRNRSTP